jgi:flagellar biosynthesis/type III secretory pathway protein FliH
MMQLKENSKISQNKVVEEEKISNALSTDEIISLLSKNNTDFVKESDISTNISNLFKTVTPKRLAEKSQETVDENNQVLEKKESEERKEETISEEVVENQKVEIEKKYTEEEAKKMSNNLAKDYYNRGYQLGVKKTTEELQKGEKALAVTLKKTTDNLFALAPDFLMEINNAISKLISKLCQETLGYEIDKKSDFFLKKIENLANSIEGSVNGVKVFLNEKDFNSIKTYNTNNNLKLSFQIHPDENLDRGDIKIRSGSIEMSEIVSKKLKFSNLNDLDSDLSKLKENPENPTPTIK